METRGQSCTKCMTYLITTYVNTKGQVDTVMWPQQITSTVITIVADSHLLLETRGKSNIASL